VEEAFQGKGLGKLLAVAYYEHVARQGATTIGLGTEDTSGGFWKKQGIVMSGQTDIAVVRTLENNQAFTIG
jgi:GNAT superfamily N-acetyltransferase